MLTSAVVRLRGFGGIGVMSRLSFNSAFMVEELSECSLDDLMGGLTIATEFWNNVRGGLRSDG